MLKDELERLAKAVDYLSDQQVDAICDAFLERFRTEIGAFKIDIWVREPGINNDILRRYFQIDTQGSEKTEAIISLSDNACSLIAWVAENKKPLLIETIPEKGQPARNSLDSEMIDSHHLVVDPRTKSFAAVPIAYRSQSAVLSVEASSSHRLKDMHVNKMREFVPPIGLLIWKASVSRDNQKQTGEVIRAFAQANRGRFDSLYPLKAGFVARPFSDEFNTWEAAVRDGLRRENVYAKSHQPSHDGRVIQDQVMQRIRMSHFGIIEATGLNSNVFIEFGAMLGLQKPFLLFGKDGTIQKLPFDVSSYKCYEYYDDGGSIAVRTRGSAVPLHVVLKDFVGTLSKDDDAFSKAEDWDGVSQP